MKEFMLSITLSQLSSAEIDIDRLKINNFHTDAGHIFLFLFVEEWKNSVINEGIYAQHDAESTE